MASNFTVLSRKFYDQVVNGEDFTSNPSRFNEVLTGNVGDKIRLIERLQIAVDYGVNESKNVTFNKRDWDITFSSFTWSNNAYLEGFYIGAQVRITKVGGSSTNFTILGITGVDNKEVLISKTDGTNIATALSISFDTGYSNLQFRQRTAPVKLKYKYGINPTSDPVPSYSSSIDSNELQYVITPIPTTPTYGDMEFAGGQLGSSLGDVSVTFIETLDNYRHTFEVIHDFTIQFYKAEEYTNITTLVQPIQLIGGTTLRYDNRYEFGNYTYQNSIFINTGLTGNVGYFNENYNGLVNDYTITDLVITNASGSGVLEATESNHIAFKVISSTDDFNSGIACLLTHSKLPTPLEYQNKVTPFDTIWIYERVLNTEGSGAHSGTIIQDLEIYINGTNPKQLDVECSIEFTTDEQELIDASNYLLYFTVANKNLTSSTTIDRVNLVVDVDAYSKNLDLEGLITNHQIDFYPSWAAFDGQSAYSNFTGGDGDLWGVKTRFKLDTVRNAKMIRATFKVYSTDGTNEIILINKPYTIGLIMFTTDGVYNYQLMNIDYPSDLNLPYTEAINRMFAEIELPVSLPSTTQDVELRCGFQITWRDWIENLTVPLSFYDVSELQNNRNYRTSNYAGALSFEVYGAMEVDITNSVNGGITTYRIESDISDILNFDVAGWTGFDGVTKIYNLDGDEVGALNDAEDVIIKIEFTHALGTLSVSDLAGEIWAENKLGIAKPDYLATYRYWTNDLSCLQPSDTLETGNYQFVEIVSASNKVTLICKSNHLNISAGGLKNIYGRLWNKA